MDTAGIGLSRALRRLVPTTGGEGVVDYRQRRWKADPKAREVDWGTRLASARPTYRIQGARKATECLASIDRSGHDGGACRDDYDLPRVIDSTKMVLVARVQPN